MLALEQGAFDNAVRELAKGLSQIETLEDMDDDTFRFERERSTSALQELLGQIEKKRPLSELELLEKQVKTAIERQEFEQAAVLRDRIRILRNQHTC
jgi:protein-arginine kinase activator protein McsA